MTPHNRKALECWRCKRSRVRLPENGGWLLSYAPLLIYMVNCTKRRDLQSFTSASYGNSHVFRCDARKHAAGMGCSFEIEQLLCDQQVLCKRPLLVDPLRLAAEAGNACHREHFFWRVFVAAFG